MKDCFNLFPIAPTLDVIKEECSAAGFDRLVPTHTPAGQAFIESKYSDISLFWNAVKLGWNNNGSLLDYATTSWNPNLDCLVWTWKTSRQQESDPSNIKLDAVNDLPSFFESAKKRWYSKKTESRKQKRDKRRKGPRKRKRTLKNKSNTRQNNGQRTTVLWTNRGGTQYTSQVQGRITRKGVKKTKWKFLMAFAMKRGRSRVPLRFYQGCFFLKNI